MKKLLVMIVSTWDLGKNQGMLEHSFCLPVMALLTQIVKVTEQAALSEGRWGFWDLFPIQDPEGNLTSTAAPVEVAALAILNRERQALGRGAGAGLGGPGDANSWTGLTPGPTGNLTKSTTTNKAPKNK